MEKQRDKLIELIVNAKRADPETGSFTEFLADFLLGYGVFVPDDGYYLDHLRELVEADKDGRCVVLPCKVEDDVYINLLGRTIPLTVISISWLTETPTFKAMNGVTMYYIFKSEDVGKTVFLTREAAEEALKGKQNG